MTRQSCWGSIQKNLFRRIYVKIEFPEEGNAVVLDHQHGRRVVTCKPAITISAASFLCLLVKQQIISLNDCEATRKRGRCMHLLKAGNLARNLRTLLIGRIIFLMWKKHRLRFWLVVQYLVFHVWKTWLLCLGNSFVYESLRHSFRWVYLRRYVCNKYQYVSNLSKYLTC